MSATRCRLCRRRLKQPESIERGLGPVCWAKAARRARQLTLNLDEGEREQGDEQRQLVFLSSGSGTA